MAAGNRPTRVRFSSAQKSFLSAVAILASLALLTMFSYALAQEASKTGRAIVRLDPQFEQFVPQNAKLEKIADGFTWTEGPVWNRAEKYLLFSEVPKNSIHKWDPKKGISLFLNPCGYHGTEPFTGREGIEGIDL